jgi:hypothetical protein
MTDDVPFDELAPVRRRQVVMARARHLLAVFFWDYDELERWFDKSREDMGGRTPRELVEVDEYERVLAAARDPRRDPSRGPGTPDA